MTQQEKLRLEELMAELRLFTNNNAFVMMGEQKLAELLELLIMSQNSSQL
ncbi:hypothetical protein ABGT15_04745 [Flavobacterium enshiense]